MSQTTDNSVPIAVPALAFELSEDERATALRVLQKRNKRLLGVGLSFPVVAVVFAIYLLGESMDWRGGSVAWIVLLLGVIFALLSVQSRRALTKAAREQPAALSVRLMNDGLHLRSAMGETKFSWHGVQGAERHADLVLVFLTNLQAVPLPVRAFASEEAADAFLGAINLKTAVDGRKTHQVAVATEQFERRSITGLELLRSRENCPESRANTRSALFGSNDNCGF